MSFLTKWPRLLVTGQPVTPTQANEILVRTCDPWIATNTNNKAWNATVRDILGTPAEPDWHRIEDIDKRTAAIRAHLAAENAVARRLGIVGLNYLTNARISSTWIGGPHGWCNWDGTIGCGNYNIGKWPEVEEITEDWTALAEAFPYLDLTCQVRTDEGEGPVAAEWRVTGGTVTLRDTPGPAISPHAELTDGQILERFTGRWSERGVSEERLREAVRQVTRTLPA